MLSDLWLDVRAVFKHHKRLKDIDYVTYTLFIVCCIFFVLSFALEMIYDSQVNAQIVLGAYYRPFVIINYEYWRLFTAAFIHGGLLHLVCNMLALLSCGPMVEKMFGHKWYAIIVMGSIGMGSMFAHLTGAELCVGLSGGLYGVIGAMVVLAWYHNWFQIPNIRNSFIRTACLNLGISLLPGVSLMAHLGGLIFGVLCAMYSLQTIHKKRSSVSLNSGIALVILCVVLIVQVIRDPRLDRVYIQTDIEVIEIYQDLHIPMDKKIEQLEEYYQDFFK
ncbi:MAG: rhomboid family intramembrane serine protease [Erysipelotrichales bacterium]|nr:rhomboid family intramembrane serine protease [Erysipelotrichales bacterium]